MVHFQRHRVLSDTEVRIANILVQYTILDFIVVLIRYLVTKFKVSQTAKVTMIR
jgi:hypothetical protein